MRQSNGPEQQSSLLTPMEVAAELRVSRATVYRLINEGQIPAVHIGAGRGAAKGRATRIQRTALAAYIASCERGVA